MQAFVRLAQLKTWAHRHHGAMSGGSARPVLLPAGSNTLAVLVGNNKNLWDRFQAAYEHEEALQQDADPLDCYAQHCIQSAAGSLG